MKTCIIMIGETPRRSLQAIILHTLYKNSGLGYTVQIIGGESSVLSKGLDAASKSGVDVIIVDAPNTTIEDRAQIIYNPNIAKYKLCYRITDKNNYHISEPIETKII